MSSTNVKEQSSYVVESIISNESADLVMGASDGFTATGAPYIKV
jgi:hypothetical protein